MGKYIPPNLLLEWLADLRLPAKSAYATSLWLLLPAYIALLSSCASLSPFQNPHEFAQELAAKNGFTIGHVPTSQFVLTTFHRWLDTPVEEISVYIEGDGHAWKTRHRLSTDPTPRNPMGLRLAVQDPSSAVLYIARPCQYTTEETRTGCDPIYWSSHRFAEEVVASIDEAISRVVEKSGATSVGLIGYSGGAAIATLVAARRDDVAWLVSVAGNLDHQSWTNLHRLTPLHGSLNPADYTRRLQTLPQLHFAGAADKRVPVAVAHSYIGRFAAPTPHLRLEVIPDFEHDCCWAHEWATRLCRQQFWGQASCAGRTKEKEGKW